MSAPTSELVNHLTKHGQEHLLQWWDELTDPQQASLVAQIESVDFAELKTLWQRSRQSAAPAAGEKLDRASAATAPAAVVLQPTSAEDEQHRQEAAALGEQLLGDGKIAVITVAGGQGSRLGFDHPKGMYPVGPVTGRTLFQIFAEQLLARKQRHAGEIPWLIMTSSATHSETVNFFQQNNYFGLAAESVHFIQQGSMPAVDAATGRLLMSDRDSLCLSPDGHGGLVTALSQSGLLAKMAARGIEHFFYHQVDNPTVVLCDPPLLGVHAQQGSQLTTNVVRKISPSEPMGCSRGYRRSP